MEYHDSEKAKDVASRVEVFMEDEVLPREREALRTGDRISFDELEDYWEMAKDRDLFAPQMPEKYGGQGLGFQDMLPSFEQVGRSLFGALATRANAPDEGNMHTLEIGGNERIKEEYLRPLVQGEMWSAFSMTEPMNGGGADPKMLQTTAEKDGDEWVINGHKWWTSNGKIADLLLVMARTDPDAHPYEGASIILVPVDTDGVEIVRNYDHLGGHGVMETEFGHAEVTYDNVRVPVGNTIGEENGGFRLAQLRLGGRAVDPLYALLGDGRTRAHHREDVHERTRGIRQFDCGQAGVAPPYRRRRDESSCRANDVSPRRTGTRPERRPHRGGDGQDVHRKRDE